MALGFKALSWSAERQIPEEERISSKAMGFTMGFALVLFTAIFIVIPAFVNNGIANYFGVEGFAFHLVEGAIRLGDLPRLPGADRADQGHQARVPVPRRRAQGDRCVRERRRGHRRSRRRQFSTEHVRCGTNFLLTVMVVTIFVYSFVGRPSLPYLIRVAGSS